MRGQLTLFLVSLLMASWLGCAGEPTEFPVQGNATLDGDPLVDATISFVPHDDAQLGASVRTDLDGNYSAEISEDRPGLAIGKYTVSISTYDEGDLEADPPLPPVRERVPSKYNYDSQLVVDVLGENNVFNFELDGKGKIE